MSLYVTCCVCDTLQHTAIHCNTQQHTATDVDGRVMLHVVCVTHCNTLNTLQHSVTKPVEMEICRHRLHVVCVTHCKTLQYTAKHYSTLQEI